jgi:hypothetical protein
VLLSGNIRESKGARGSTGGARLLIWEVHDERGNEASTHDKEFSSVAGAAEGRPEGASQSDDEDGIFGPRL